MADFGSVGDCPGQNGLEIPIAFVQCDARHVGTKDDRYVSLVRGPTGDRDGSAMVLRPIADAAMASGNHADR